MASPQPMAPGPQSTNMNTPGGQVQNSTVGTPATNQPASNQTPVTSSTVGQTKKSRFLKNFSKN